MNIYELLKKTNARVSLEDKWLVINEKRLMVVYQKKAYAKNTKILIETKYEHEAIAYLVRG